MHIKTGQQKTFQFIPEVLTRTQEYLVLEKIGNDVNELIQYDQENNRMFDENDDEIYLSFVVLPPQNTQEPTTSEGGCLIATATYGSEMSQQVQQLRELRDNQLLQTASGTQFMAMFNDVYYSFSPVIADYERENPLFKEAVKLAITPMISSLSLMENAESESEILSIGISVIVLNLGMYLGVPAIVTVGIRKITF
jgi:peptidyl-prolyl cis-trans isomerase B (cyclophilin B)